MANLNHPAIDPGMLSAADLETARRNNPGSIWQISPHRLLPHGCDQSGRYATRQWGQFPDTIPTQPAEACTDIGAEPDPYDGTAVFRGVFSALCITALLCAVVVVLAA